MPVLSLALALIGLQTETPARFTRFPTLSPDGKQVCFSYQGNLWVVSSQGGVATRLTANDSYDSNPKWSPDGKWIAFNSDREGGMNIFVIPSVGGPAKQVTDHSSATSLGGWYPGGDALVATSGRESLRSTLYRIDLASGRMKRLLHDNRRILQPTVSPDGKWIAYAQGSLSDVIRKGYRGAAAYQIMILPTDASGPARKLTEGERSSMWPVWSPDSKSVVTASERGGGLQTLWRLPVEGGKPQQLVASPPDAIRYTSAAQKAPIVAFECDNRIGVMGLTPGAPQFLDVLCRTDERGPKVSNQTFSSTGVSEFQLSPDGKRAAIVLRGDVFWIPLDRPAEARRLTETPTRERDVAWTPDGKSLVYSSNQTGSYNLYRLDLASRDVKPLTQSKQIDTNPEVSPDGQWVAFLRGPQTRLMAIKLDGTGEREVVPGPKIDEPQWSPDGKWIAYSREDDVRTNDIWVVGFDPAGKPSSPINVSAHPGFQNSARWFPDGSRLAFRSNRYRNRDIETINHQGRYTLYTVALQKEKEKFDEDEEPKKPDDKKPDEKKPLEVKIDPDEIERRAKQTVGLDENFGTYSISPDSKAIVFVVSSAGRPDLWQMSADGGSVQRLTTSGEGPSDIQWAPDSSKFYFLSRGALQSIPRGGGPVATAAFTARMAVDRLVDYYAAFDEAVQVIGDNFYDKTFRGLDFKAISARYRAMIPFVSVRTDFASLVTQWLGELNASHTGWQGTTLRTARPTGYLGVTVDEDYPGPGVKVAAALPRSPVTRAESSVKPGEFILAVDGVDVRAGLDFDRALADKVGRTVRLLVGPRASREGARTVLIKPITEGAHDELLYEQWIDQRRAIVEKASGGKLGYLHVADMGDTARNRFERDLFSQGPRKQGMVLDFRGNNGGDTHDSLLRMLERSRTYFNFAPRTETPFPQPERAVTWPTIVLIDEASLSDAEVFANGYRELGIGKLVGRPTMGWIIFTWGTSLVDGSFLRIPGLGCFTKSGRDMENWGVPPDILVEPTTEDDWKGRDVQLERAVQELLKTR